MQVKGFSPECVSLCFLRSPFVVHLYSHYWQLNGFTPVWNRMWMFRWEVAVNEEAHIGRLWVFSPPFFVQVWSVKRIVQSSVFADTFHKFIPMQIFLCPATNVTIHAQRLMPSRNTCALIQERSLLVATNVIFPAQRHVTSRYTFEPTQVGSLSGVISATILQLKLNIWRHTFSHTGARPFTCNQCSYSCNRSDSMKRHMLSHTGFCLHAMQLLLHKVNSA